MADKKISQLTDGTSLQSGDFVVVARSGDNFKVDPTVFDEITATTADINGGTIDGVTIGGSSADAGSFTTLNTSGAVVFNDAGADVDFRVEGDTDANLLFVDAGNDRVGIGTNSPATALDVTGTVTADGLVVDGDLSSPPIVRINNAGGSWVVGDEIGRLQFFTTDPSGVGQRELASIRGICNANTSAGEGALEFWRSEANSASLKAVDIASNGDISFYEDTGTTPKFFWDASAEALGIGTTSPTGRLSIDTGTITGLNLYRSSANANFSAITFKDTTNAGTNAQIGWNANELRLEGTNIVSLHTSSAEAMRIDSAGKLLLNTAVHTLTDTEMIVASEYDASGTTTSGITLSARASGSWRNVGIFANGTDLTFTTNDVGLNGAQSSSERMRITSAGNVGIGTTSPATTLDVNSPSTNNTPIEWLRATGTRGALFSDGGGVGILQGALSEAGIYLVSNSRIDFRVNGSERMRIDTSGNLLVGGTGTPTSSAGNFVLYNGTAPTGNATNGVILYAEDVSASSELKVRDEAGNVTTLSPHNFDLIPEGPSEDMAWSYYSERDGKRINVDMLKAIRLLEQLSGEKLVHIV